MILRKDTMALYTPPFRYSHGYIFDSKSHMVADQGGCTERDKSEDMMAAQIRGWGRIGYMPNAAALQDDAGQMICDALNAYYARPHGEPPSGSLVEQLRATANNGVSVWGDLQLAAANEIERLQGVKP